MKIHLSFKTRKSTLNSIRKLDHQFLRMRENYGKVRHQNKQQI